MHNDHLEQDNFAKLTNMLFQSSDFAQAGCFFWMSLLSLTALLLENGTCSIAAGFHQQTGNRRFTR